jgi:hypothetical protein
LGTALTAESGLRSCAFVVRDFAEEDSVGKTTSRREMADRETRKNGKRGKREKELHPELHWRLTSLLVFFPFFPFFHFPFSSIFSMRLKLFLVVRSEIEFLQEVPITDPRPTTSDRIPLEGVAAGWP